MAKAEEALCIIETPRASRNKYEYAARVGYAARVAERAGERFRRSSS